jgi:predicted 3-demethylubiquinone-9 3-methyltransferase (glyoxalase superfamily)
MKITTFLTFDDEAEEAVALYTSVFERSKIVEKTYYGELGPMPKGTLMTVVFELEGQTFYALNGGPSFTFTQGISLFVSCETQAEIDDLWSKLTAGGGKEVACGWLVDRFGVSWQIVPIVLWELLHDKDAARAKRTMAAMMKMVKLDIAKLKAAADAA